MTNEQSPLNDYELDWLAQAKALIPGEPPPPWQRHLVIEAAGIFACGWTKAEDFLLISHDGYTLTSMSSKERLITDFDEELPFSHLSDHELHFQMPETGEMVDTFGLRAGDGIHVSSGWILKAIYPWWPHAKLTLNNSRQGGFGRIWQNVYGIKLMWINDYSWIKYGFSPSGLHFAVIGEAGAEIFSDERFQISGQEADHLSTLDI